MINYYLLTKPGIIFGNLATVAAGFLLASRGQIDLTLFLAALLGLTLVMASACVLNNYLDKETDRQMERTKNRPLVKGTISEIHALIFAFSLGTLGCLILLGFTNFLTACVAGFGFFIYVVPYTLWKSRTVYGTAIGSLAGAVPPVVGYCAARNHLDAGAFILFAMMVLWQMPHFFAIAIRHLDDYKAAKIPVLPLEKGFFKTKIHMTLYIIGFIVTSALLTFFNYTGYFYLGIVTGLGLIWLGISLLGFRREFTRNDPLKKADEKAVKAIEDRAWAGSMFRVSLAVIGAVCIAIPCDLLITMQHTSEINRYFASYNNPSKPTV